MTAATHILQRLLMARMAVSKDEKNGRATKVVFGACCSGYGRSGSKMEIEEAAFGLVVVIGGDGHDDDGVIVVASGYRLSIETPNSCWSKNSASKYSRSAWNLI